MTYSLMYWGFRLLRTVLRTKSKATVVRAASSGRGYLPQVLDMACAFGMASTRKSK